VTALSSAGREVRFKWEDPGKKVGYDDKYTTSTTAGAPKVSLFYNLHIFLYDSNDILYQYVAWISQLNTTFTKLSDIKDNCGSSKQPGGNIFGDDSALLINDTMFVFSCLCCFDDLISNRVLARFALITDDNPFVTPFNLAMLNKHVVAGPAIYQAG
jgi:hypothetical protein